MEQLGHQDLEVTSVQLARQVSLVKLEQMEQLDSLEHLEQPVRGRYIIHRNLLR